jgi:hypothetical protein
MSFCAFHIYAVCFYKIFYSDSEANLLPVYWYIRALSGFYWLINPFSIWVVDPEVEC